MGYIAASATKDKKAVSLRGRIKNIGKQNLDIMFEKNLYMKDIYPGDTREALEVFCIYEAQGEYFDITNPSKILRESIVIGEQKVPVSIEQNHCLHCGRCAESCPKQCIEKRG